MSEKAAHKGAETGTAGTRKPNALRWVIPALLLSLLILTGLVGRTIAPYLFNGVTLVSEVAEQVRATTGLALTTDIGGRFDLLPSPHIVLHTLHVADPSGTLSIDADGLDGDVRLLPLIVGRIELSSATLLKPRLTIDLDARPMKPDSLIGRAMHTSAPTRGDQRLGTVALSDGTAVIKSKLLRRIPELEAINVTLDWHDLDSPATLAGALSLRKTAVDLSAWIAQPRSLMRGDRSAVAIHVHSAPVDFSANGDLVSATTTGFRGRLAINAPSITDLLDLLGENTTLLAPFANVSLTSDATVSMDPKAQTSFDLQSLKLRADGNDYEGTLALQTGERPLLSGTLATEQLMLAPFLHRVPQLVTAERGWSIAPILGREPQPLDLDLRISATHMRLAPFTIDDAALAVMTRGDRTEVALAEGKAYGGALKARFSVGIADDGINLRGTGSIANADASTLTWDTFGRQLAAGTLSGSANLETSGASPAALMRGLHGSAKGSVVGGELSGVDLGRGLREAANNKMPAVVSALRSGRTPFASLVLGARVVDGIATIEDSEIAGPDAAVAISGSTDIGARGLDVRAVATPPGTQTPPSNAPIPRLSFDIRGSFDKPIVKPDFDAGLAPAKGPAP